MSQPPGPYGAPSQYAPPGQYGAPGPYGTPGQYGAPGPYGGPGGYGQPPKQKNVLPWVITAIVVVLAGVGVLLFFLLGRDDDPAPRPAAGSSSAEASDDGSEGTGSEESGSEESGSEEGGGGMEMGGPVEVPGGAGTPGTGGGAGSGSGGAGGAGGGMTEQTGGGADAGAIPGSSDLALAWVQAVYDLDTATVYNLSCVQLQDAAVQGSQGTEYTPDEYLTYYLYSQVLGGLGITEGTLVALQYDAANAVDVATFELVLEDGSTQVLEVWVDETLLVCDFY